MIVVLVFFFLQIEWAQQHPLMESKYQPKVVAPAYHVDFHTVASDDDDVLDEGDDGLSPHTIIETDHHHHHHDVKDKEAMNETSQHMKHKSSIDPKNNAITNNSKSLSLLLTRQPSISPPSSPSSPRNIQRKEPQSLAKRLVLSMKNASLATEWKPSPHLKVRVRVIYSLSLCCFF